MSAASKLIHLYKMSLLILCCFYLTGCFQPIEDLTVVYNELPSKDSDYQLYIVHYGTSPANRKNRYIRGFKGSNRVRVKWMFWYIEGNGKVVEGAIRACTSPDGHKFREKIVILDKKNMYYTYEVLEGVPAKMKNTFRVVPLGEGISKVVWESNYSFIENPMMKENQFFAFINMNGQKIVNEVAAYFNL